MFQLFTNHCSTKSDYSDTKEGGKVSLLKQPMGPPLTIFISRPKKPPTNRVPATHLKYRGGQGGEITLLQLLLNLLLVKAAVRDRDRLDQLPFHPFPA